LFFFITEIVDGKAPNSKPQAAEKFQISSLKRNMVTVRILTLGTSPEAGGWCLGFFAGNPLE
jgi:hypothetical protein